MVKTIGVFNTFCLGLYARLAFETGCSAFTLPSVKNTCNLQSTTELQANAEDNRRTFLVGTSAALAGAVSLGGAAVLPSEAVDIKVTPMAHTFITASGAPKPLRENDATRFLTNARVAYLFFGKNPDVLPPEVLKLTNTRKIEKGPGVTPGQIHVATANQAVADVAASLSIPSPTVSDFSSDTIAKLAASLPEGDTLVVGPIASGGVAADGQKVADCAKALGSFVGGGKSNGVLSVLLDGPNQGLEMEAQGFPVSTILWYSF